MRQERRLLYLASAEDSHCAEAVDHEELVERIRGQGWRVSIARSTPEAHEHLKYGNFRVGLACLDKARLSDIGDIVVASPRTEWVALLDGRVLSSPEAREVVGCGFYDYHTRPVDPSRLFVTLGHAWGMSELRQRDETSLQVDSQYEMVGRSSAMQLVFRRIAQVARTDVPVLITGDTGTGKELIANAIHVNSSRALAPFNAVNCGALASGLIQSELFGHEKGAFTGAHRRRIGHLEAANGGTVFLDEIGDLPPEMQTNLLRFLEQRLITRVGGTESIPVDARIVAATHIDLARAVREGRFRDDLYYRLNVFPLHAPSLSERGEDIALLARYFFDKFIGDRNGPVTGFSPEALEALKKHDWPGNIRELLNRVRRSLVACEGRLISPRDLGLEAGPRNNDHARTLVAARADAERESVEQALRQARDNVSHAARSLGVSRVTMYRLMRKHAIYVE